MVVITKEQLKSAIDNRKLGRLSFVEHHFKDMDLSGFNLSNIDFSHSDFENVTMEKADLSKSVLHHTYFSHGCSFRGANFIGADLTGSIFRYCDFEDSNMCGANLYCSVFEFANMKNIKTDNQTKYFEMRCPEEGAFLGYKRCFNDLLVQLLIPADAKRCSSTTDACRCNKAKVLSIHTFDMSQKVEEAWSVVDEEFVYRVGEYVSVSDFNEDRWMESTTGIHFWMTREEAYSYLE